MNVIKVTTKAQLDALYEDWSLTIEGLAPDEKNLKELLDWVKDCTLACVKLADMENPNRVAIPRFQIGGRWFYDIVENNARREEEKRTGTEG